jgi:hypothetical protein
VAHPSRRCRRGNGGRRPPGVALPIPRHDITEQELEEEDEESRGDEQERALQRAVAPEFEGRDDDASDNEGGCRTASQGRYRVMHGPEDGASTLPTLWGAMTIPDRGRRELTDFRDANLVDVLRRSFMPHARIR